MEAGMEADSLSGKPARYLIRVAVAQVEGMPNWAPDGQRNQNRSVSVKSKAGPRALPSSGLNPRVEKGIRTSHANGVPDSLSSGGLLASQAGVSGTQGVDAGEGEDQPRAILLERERTRGNGGRAFGSGGWRNRFLRLRLPCLLKVEGAPTSEKGV
jgi:hypothetical protein